MADGLEFFLGLEEAVWQALTHGDVDADRSMLSTDFLGVYRRASPTARNTLLSWSTARPLPTTN